MDVLAKPKVRKVIEERANQGLCIIPDCPHQFVTRGLCQTHSNQFFGRMRSCSCEEERMNFENEAIREGLVLPIREQAKYRETTNPFSRIAQ